MALEKIEREKYVSILSSDATFRIVVPEGTEGSIVREYETSDGKKGKKTEMVFQKLTGKITNVAFFDGDFGKLIQLDVTDEAGTLVLSVNTAQNYGEDLMKKLPNIDLEKPVELTPYAFEDDRGKLRKGVTVTQDGKKIQNYFYDPITKKNVNGYPDPEGDIEDYEKDDWKIYFMQARKFLIAFIENKFPNKKQKTISSDVSDIYPTEEINPDSIPF